MQIQDNSSDEKGSIFVIDLYQGATLSLITIVVKSQNETKRLWKWEWWEIASTRRVQETKVMKSQEQFWSAGPSKLYKLDHQIYQSDQFGWQRHCGTANCACTCACRVFHFVLQIFEGGYRIICTIYVRSLNEQLLQLCPTVHDVKHSYLHFQTPCLGQLDKMLTELKRVTFDVRWSWMMECSNMAGKWVIQNFTSSLALLSTFWPFPGPEGSRDNQDKQIFRVNLARLKLILG